MSATTTWADPVREELHEMKRTIRTAIHWTLVICLVTILSVSPATAGWLLENLGSGHGASCAPKVARCVVAPQPVCCVVPVCPAPEPTPVCCPPPNACEAPLVMAPVVMSAPVISDCCPGEGVVPMAAGEVISSDESVQRGHQTPPAPPAPVIVDEVPADEVPAEEVPVEEAPVEEAPAEEPSAPAEE